MKDEDKSRNQLISELAVLRRQVAELENDKADRKLVEESLKESEERFRVIFDNLRDGLLLADSETKKFLMGNPAIHDMLGYSAEELNRLELADIHPEQDLPSVINRFEELARREIEIARGIPVLRKDGNVFYADISGSFPILFDGKECLMGVFRDITERRRAEESLQESETKFRTLVERRPDAVTYILDRNENLPVLYVSPQVEKIFGWPAQEYLQDPQFWLKCIHPDDYERVNSQTDRLQKTGQLFALEYRIIRKDGQVVWLHDVADLMRDENGRPISLLGVAIDITGRKQVEEQISKLNSLKEQLLGTNSRGEKLKLVTDAAVEIFGADFARIWITGEADLCDKGCLHATAAEGPDVCRDRTRCLHLMASSGRYTSTDGSHRRVPLGSYKVGRVASGEDPKFITNDITKDPAVHDHEWARNLELVSFAGFRLLSADGKPIGVLAIFGKQAIHPEEERLLQDLASTTSQVILAGMAEEALRESEVKFRALFDHSPIGISIARQGVTHLLNQAGLRMFGYDDGSEIAGTSQLNRIAPHCRDEISEYIKRRERGEAAPGTYETEGIRRDGSIFNLYVQAARIQLADGPATVVFVADITRRKVAEEELGRYRDHLEDLVKERTSELSKANEQLTRLIDEHRRAEEELREREEFLSAIVENIPDMIFVKDAKELRFVRFNRAGEDLLGYSRKDLIGRNDYDFFPRSEADFFTAKDREVLCSGHLLDIPEETIQTSRKGRRILHTKKIPIADSEGNFRHLLGISEDITERRQAEQALQASEQRYRLLLSSVTDYIFTIEIKNGMPVSTTHGQGCVAVTGYTPEDYARMPFLWYEMVHPEDVHAVIDHAETALRGETRESLEHRIIHKNGTTRWVRNTMVPRHDTVGKFVACDGLISDITERKIIEQELKQTNTYLENIFENSPDAIGIVDGSGRFIMWNRMAAELYGYTFKEMKGKSGFDLYADKDELQRMLAHLRQEGSVKKWEMKIKRKDGTIVPFEISIGLLKSNQNKTLGSVSVARDLSGIKEALAALRVTNEQLNQEITERKRAEEALLNNEETLRGSERNLRSLASQLFTIQETERNRISKELHDGLGQELTVLKIYLTSMQNKLREDQQSLRDDCESLLTRIDDSIENMRRLCHDLSPYLLEELGLSPSLEHLFNEVCQRNSLLCFLEIEEISKYLPRRTLAAVYRIFQEALTNIVKHSGATQVSLSIKKQARHLNFMVADNGKGFDIQSVTQRPASERGMGLFAMAERTRMLGGSFQILSQKGEGTQISFTLPLREKGKE